MDGCDGDNQGAGDHWVALARILMTKMVLARMTMIQTRMMSPRMISARLKVIRVGRRRRQQVWPPTPLITLFHSNEGEEFSREGRKISKSWKSHFSMGERIESFLVVWLGMSIALVWWEATHPNDTTYWVAQLGLGLQILPRQNKFSVYFSSLKEMPQKQSALPLELKIMLVWPWIKRFLLLLTEIVQPASENLYSRWTSNKPIWRVCPEDSIQCPLKIWMWKI